MASQMSHPPERSPAHLMRTLVSGEDPDSAPEAAQPQPRLARRLKPKTRDEFAPDPANVIGRQSFLELSEHHASAALDEEVVRAARFVPTAVLERLDARRGEPIEPAVTTSSGAVLFCDMSGFSKLGESLNRGELLLASHDACPEDEVDVRARGNTHKVARLFRTANIHERSGAGAEQLREVLDVFFGSIIAAIQEHGGDVVRVAGDALISVFADDDERTAVLRGVLCGDDCIDRMRDTTFRGLPLQLHAALGVGELRAFHVGGHSERWQYVLCGAPLGQIEDALDLAGASELVLSAEAAALVAGVAGVRLTPTSLVGPMRVTIEAGQLSAPPPPLGDREALMRAVAADPETREGLCKYLPVPVFCAMLDADMELSTGTRRVVTVLFVSIESLVRLSDEPEVALQRLQRVTLLLQAAVDDNFGVVKELSVDDKGMVLVAGFGVPPLVRESPPSSAVIAGERIQRELLSNETGACVGVATGLVFCGTLGSSGRQEFAMVSATVNLAARLMSAVKHDDQFITTSPLGAERRSGILVEQATWEVCSDSRLQFQRLPDIRVKGRREPVTVFIPEFDPTQPAAPELSHRLRFAPNTPLPVLGQKECAELVCATVGEDTVGSGFLDAIFVRARGCRPFVLSLANLLVSMAGKHDWNLTRPTINDIANFASCVPADARAYFDSTLNEMTAEARLFAKAAAILGVPSHASDILRLVQRFRAKRGRRVPPSQDSAQRALDGLVRSGLLRRVMDSEATTMAHPNLVKRTESNMEVNLADVYYEPCNPLLGDAVAQTLSRYDRRDLHVLCLSLYDKTELVRYVWAVQHCTYAHDEAKARTALDMLEALGPGFVTHWVDCVVSQYLELNVGRRADLTREARANMVLLSLPWLRGVWRARKLRSTGNSILKAAKKLRAPLRAREARERAQEEGKVSPLRRRSASAQHMTATSFAPRSPLDAEDLEAKQRYEALAASDPLQSRVRRNTTSQLQAKTLAAPADAAAPTPAPLLGTLHRSQTHPGRLVNAKRLLVASFRGRPGQDVVATEEESRRAEELAASITAELSQHPDLTPSSSSSLSSFALAVESVDDLGLENSPSQSHSGELLRPASSSDADQLDVLEDIDADQAADEFEDIDVVSPPSPPSAGVGSAGIDSDGTIMEEEFYEGHGGRPGDDLEDEALAMLAAGAKPKGMGCMNACVVS